MLDKTKLFVGNLQWGVSSNDLREIFSQWGNVVHAIVIKDRETGRSKGFGFVTYETEQEAAKALAESNGGTINNKVIRVSYAKLNPEKLQRTDK